MNVHTGDAHLRLHKLFMLVLISVVLTVVDFTAKFVYLLGKSHIY